MRRAPLRCSRARAVQMRLRRGEAAHRREPRGRRACAEAARLPRRTDGHVRACRHSWAMARTCPWVRPSSLLSLARGQRCVRRCASCLIPCLCSVRADEARIGSRVAERSRPRLRRVNVRGESGARARRGRAKGSDPPECRPPLALPGWRVQQRVPARK